MHYMTSQTSTTVVTNQLLVKFGYWNRHYDQNFLPHDLRPFVFLHWIMMQNWPTCTFSTRAIYLTYSCRKIFQLFVHNTFHTLQKTLFATRLDPMAVRFSLPDDISRNVRNTTSRTNAKMGTNNTIPIVVHSLANPSTSAACCSACSTRMLLLLLLLSFNKVSQVRSTACSHPEERPKSVKSGVTWCCPSQPCRMVRDPLRKPQKDKVGCCGKYKR